jgi:protein SCO1/2
MTKYKINFLFSSNNAMILNAATTETQFAEWIDQTSVNQNRLLADLLYERHPVYEGRSANVVLRMRGYAIARFEQIGLPNKALPYVLEALESSFDPYMVAAAAKALRGMKERHPQTTGYLIKAIYNIWQNDQPISFSQYHVQWPLKTYSTALIEIFTSIKWMGSYAQKFLVELELILTDFGHHLNSNSRLHLSEAIAAVKIDDRVVELGCCDLPLNLQSDRSGKKQYVNAKSFTNLIIEDQEGTQFHWVDFFEGKPILLAFFYTRCMNPRKCTLTIQNLASIQSKLKEHKIADEINVVAITYDPDHDTAATLKTYGLARKFLFDGNNKMFRVPNQFNSVVSAFDLGVNFNESLVNQHRIELFLLDKDGAVKQSFPRLQTEIETIINALKEILRGEKSIEDRISTFNELQWRIKPKANGLLSVILSILIAFFPKCPICWAVYLSAFGASSLQSIPYSPWLIPWLILAMVVNLFILYRNARIRNGRVPFWISLFGFLLVGSGHLLSLQLTSILGIILIFIGAILNSLSLKHWSKVSFLATLTLNKVISTTLINKN